jgi:hypothetical protein
MRAPRFFFIKLNLISFANVRPTFLKIRLYSVVKMKTTIESSNNNNCKEIHSHLFVHQPLIIPKRSYFKLPIKLNSDNLSRSCSFSHHHTRNKAIITKRSSSFKINRHLQVCSFLSFFLFIDPVLI